MKRIALCLSLSLLAGCYSWNTHLPASPLGYGAKEVTAVGGFNLSPAFVYPNTTDGPFALRLRLGSSAERDLGLAFAYERPCNQEIGGLSPCSPDATAYRFEVAMQHNYYESQRFYLSQGEGFGLAYLKDISGLQVPLAPSAAAWFTVGWVPIDQLEVYFSGRFSGNIGGILGVRARYARVVVSTELGLYVPLRLAQEGSFSAARERIGLSIAIGYADDSKSVDPLTPLFTKPITPGTPASQQPLPPPPPPPPIPPSAVQPPPPAPAALPPAPDAPVKP